MISIRRSLTKFSRVRRSELTPRQNLFRKASVHHHRKISRAPGPVSHCPDRLSESKAECQMERHTFLIDAAVGDRLKAIKARSGLSESEQVRRAIALWLESFGWPVQQREPGQKGDPATTRWSETRSK